MNKGHQNIVRKLVAGLILLAAFSQGVSQQPASMRTEAIDETASGIALYQDGKNEAAINVLRHVVKRDKNALSAWHFLGLALEKIGDSKEAGKAHEKAAKVGDKLLSKQLDRASSYDDIPKVIGPFGKELEEAGKSAERYLELNPKLSPFKRADWTLMKSALLDFADVSNPDSGIGKIYRPQDVDVKARILSKAEPRYAEAARAKGVTGTVLLTVTFSRYGKVMGVRVFSGLPEGLTETSVQAAQQIRFTPALKDGKPVSMYAQLEYTFSIY